MRIYDGSPRQGWADALRAIGHFADERRLKELLFLELEGGFVLQGLGLQSAGADSDSFGTTAKRTYELTDEQIAELMETAAGKRGTVPTDVPETDLTNYYEHALRIIGTYFDDQKAHDVFFFEQDGSFVTRLFGISGSRAGHQLAEFTRDEILAMIGNAPAHRNQPAPEATGAP